MNKINCQEAFINSDLLENNQKVFEKKANEKKCRVKKSRNITTKDKISKDDFWILSFSEYEKLNHYNYTLVQLRDMTRFYKLGNSGNKQALKDKIYKYLRESEFCVKIQKIYRGYLRRIYNKLHGPAQLNRDICTNVTDFYTMDDIKDIPPNQFISFCDSDKFTYGFDICSLYHLILKNGTGTENPYNRQKLPSSIIHQIRYKLRLGIILKNPVNITLESSVERTPAQRIEMRVLNVFQEMDSLGNYTDIKWFNDLNRGQLIKFIRELYDIWSYRAEISYETKCAICPHQNGPFRHFNVHGINNLNIPLFTLKHYVLTIMENMVKSGINTESKTLGAYYVLSSFTLVNSNAAESLPWLYESVVHS